MAYTTIDKPSDYFNTVLYTGNGSSNAITGVGFQPDWIWLKNRSTNNSHQLYDAVRGTTKYLESDNTDSEYTSSDGISAFGTDGFTIAGNLTGANNSGDNFVAWNWLGANGTASNTDGSITSTVSANTTAGFSIVSYTGTGSAATVGHGLGAVPKVIIQKNRIDGQPWWVYHSTIGAGGQLRLNGTNAQGSDGGVLWNSTEPTSSVFSLGDNQGSNGTSDACIAYCFAEKQGYSKFGSYIGNGNAAGTFVYTGFKPAWVMGKATSRADVWWMHDIKRSTFNPMDDRLMPQANTEEGVEWDIDYLSNGFKIRDTDAQANGSGETYIYMAFAESPFVTSTGIPNNAR